MRRHLFGSLVALVTLLSCGSGDTTDSAGGVCAGAVEERAIAPSSSPSLVDILEWSGFDETSGLEVLAFDEHCGIDVLVEVAMTGESDAVDSALRSAGFEEQPAPGLSSAQPPLEGVDLELLINPVSAVQLSWDNGESERISRMYVRGQLKTGDEELLHVWAFTT